MMQAPQPPAMDHQQQPQTAVTASAQQQQGIPAQWGVIPPPAPATQYQQTPMQPAIWNQQPSQIAPPVTQTQMATQYQQQYPPQYQQYTQYPAATGAAVQQQQAPGSEEIRTLWIGDLQYWMDENFLNQCFMHTGEVLSVKVIRNKQTQQSEGYGFIEFATKATAERVLQTFNGQMMPGVDQVFRMNWATAGERRADDGPDYTIFVGDLASDVTDYTLQETFRSHYPSIKGAKVVTDRTTGRSKGYGFVRFGDPTEQQRAMTEMNGMFCSTRPMRIGPATNKKSIGPQQQASQDTQGTQSESDPNNTTIFVGGLDPNVTEDVLRQLFSPFGELVHVKIPAGKRCGFVQFAQRHCAEEALLMLQGHTLGGQSIRLSWGRSPSSKQSQQDSNQWNGNYYGYGQGYESYGYTQPQEPNMYAYGGYPGYGNYQQQQQQQ